MPGDPRFRVLYAIWAFLECLGFGGLIYGWVSLVYILKDEGLYMDLCADSMVVNVSSLFKGKVTGIDTVAINSSVADKADVSYNDISTSSSLSLNSTVSESVAAMSGCEAVANAAGSGGSCPAREEKLNLAFTVGSAMFCVGCCIMGQVNFKFGTRITRIGALVLFIAGALMIALTSNDVPWLIFPGLSLIGSGGITYLVTNTQIASLFPRYGSMVVGLLCGGFDASSGVQLMVKLGYEHGISRQTSYYVIAAAHLLTLVSTFFFLPKDFIRKPSSSPSGSPDVADDKDAAVELTDKSAGVAHVAPPASLLSYLKSPTYILHVVWLSLLQVRFYFFLGSFNVTLEKLVDCDKDEVSHYTNVLMYMMMCGMFASPFAGFVYDSHNKFFVNSRSELRRKLMPAVGPLAYTTAMCLLMSLLILVESKAMLYPTFILLVLFRSFMYTMAAGFTAAIVPSEYFGVLYGILILTGGLISYAQNILFKWSAESGSFFQPNVFLVVLSALTLVHPLWQWRVASRAEASADMQTPAASKPMMA